MFFFFSTCPFSSRYQPFLSWCFSFTGLTLSGWSIIPLCQPTSIICAMLLLLIHPGLLKLHHISTRRVHQTLPFTDCKTISFLDLMKSRCNKQTWETCDETNKSEIFGGFNCLTSQQQFQWYQMLYQGNEGLAKIVCHVKEESTPLRMQRKKWARTCIFDGFLFKCLFSHLNITNCHIWNLKCSLLFCKIFLKLL